MATIELPPMNAAVETGFRHIDVRPLNPVIGAEIHDVDLTGPLSDAVIDEIRRAFAKHIVIFFRDQRISFDDHKRFAALFGDAHIAPSTVPWRVPDHPEITKIHADAESTYIAGEDWHSDMSCDPEPPLGSILYLHTLPSNGGDTLFSSMYAAYEALSDRMKAYLEGLNAVHDAVASFGAITPPGLDLPRSTHPVIRTHPVTGKRAIYVNKGYTLGIEGMPAAESAAVLDFLYEHVKQPIFQCRFIWRQHSIAFWDNRCSQHLAVWDYFPETRSGFRIQIAGDRPR